MKIAMYNVTTHVVKGGIETFCIKAAEELVRQGFDARVICGTNLNSPEQFEKNGVRYHAFPFKKREEFPDFGTRFRKLCKRISFANNCMEFLMEENFDIIHVHKPFEFPVMYYLKAKGSKSRVVFGSHGTDFFMSDRFFFRRVVDASVTCSNFNALEVQGRYGISPEVIYNGAETDIFRPVDPAEARRLCGLKPAGRYLGTLGRLIGLKGIQVLLRAMPVVLKEYPEVVLLIVGDGPYRAELEALAEKLGIRDNIAFAGGIDHDKLPAWINAMDLLAQPSIGDESFGITVVEAMSCGKPVVATASGGMPEIVSDGETGFIVPKRDEKLLAERIVTLLKNKDLASSMGTKGRERVIAEFTWEKVAQRLIRVYERIGHGDSVIS
jgi:glycosyltransferase involved in cell wall biosynthesis